MWNDHEMTVMALDFAAKRSPQEPMMRLLEAREFRAMGKPREALRAIEAAMAWDPTNPMLVNEKGVLGARFTGDDCVACLVESSQAKGVMKAIEADYKERTGVSCSVFVCNPSQGAHLLQEEGAVEKRLWQRPLLWVGVASVAAAAMMVVLRSRRSCCVCLQTYSCSLMSMLAILFYNLHIINPIH